MMERVKSESQENVNTENIQTRDIIDVFGSEDPHDQHLPGYNCVHDVIANSLGIEASTSSSPSAKRVSLKSTLATNFQTLRFYFDTSFLYNNVDTLSCKKAGQVVYLGGTTKDTPNVAQCNGQTSRCYIICKDNDVLSVDVANLISRDILTTVQETLGEMLLVDRVVGNLILPTVHDRQNVRTCDVAYTIPDSYFNYGVPNADIIVFVTSRPVYSQSTIAYAAPCIYKDGNRPLAATINFNTRYFSPFVSNVNKPSSFIFNEYIRVGMHEMTHGLGFTNEFFKNYKDQNGLNYNPIPGSSVTIVGYTGSDVRFNVTRAAISTPSVKQFVQNHYQCFDQSKGYQLLEDYGSQGTAGSHWEKRTVGEEYMLGYVSPVFPITGLTLSLFEDMGWYKANTSLAEPLMWGKGLGCDWFNNCDRKGWNYPGYFCEDSNTVSCSPTRVGKGKCNVQRWDQVPPQYQHFRDPSLAGDYISDGCPFYEVGSSYCVDDNNNGYADPTIGEYYGQDSRCFEYSSSIDSSYRNLACWKFECDNDSTLKILVNNQWVSCTYPGRKFLINQVSFECPHYFYPCKNTTSYEPPANSSTLNYPGISLSNSSSKLSFNTLSFILLFILITIIKY